MREASWATILWSNGKSRVGLVMLAVFVLAAVLADVLAPYDPKVTDYGSSLPPSSEHLLGTTAAGQDMLSQLIHGARTSIIVGVLAGLLVTVIALLIGLTAGYLQGWVDEVLSFVINLALVVPVLPLMITIAAYSPVRGLGLIVFVISITGWAWGARVKRAQILTLRSRDYITAARFAGDGTIRIVFREIMPNMMSLVVAGFLGAAGGAIGAEAGLEFLGLGDPTTVSWGTMLYWANNSGAMLTGQWIWLGAPGLCIALLLTSLTLINFGVDALSNPHLREE
jgi:peptide/nickel transport system permease protein